uniref:Myo-inositol 2-dehydrogenase n=1 Tax=uncultured Armatimonadetes bacterium TaxID=157466 RepID=A0A6J4I130_9BACT|nr:Myo-inositol 2-dehydrogenase [uncultured Armatimonadetes bacterium]
MAGAARKINIGLVGYQFMGKAHSNAFRQVGKFFPDLEAEPVLKALCGRSEEKVKAAADKFGFESYETDYRKLLERDDIDLIDIVTPGNSHAEIAVAAANAGKMVVCEKPLANTVPEAEAMLRAARENNVPNAVCFNYRRIPAIALAKKMIAEGRIGKVFHFRGVYLQDWIVDPNFPIVWRLQGDVAGSGSHGDLNAHLIDIAHYLVGPITEVSGMLDTFIKQRPLLAESDDRLGGKASDQMGEVTVDDSSIFIARFDSGTLGTFEATRLAPGRKNHSRWEINGEKGSLVFNMERMNELEYYNADDPEDVRGFRVIQTTDNPHPYTANYWPAGHIIGYEHTFINFFHDVLNDFAAGRPTHPDFADGLACQKVLDAVDRSSKNRAWEQV